MHAKDMEKPKFSAIVDTTNLSVSQSVEYIVSKLELNQ